MQHSIGTRPSSRRPIVGPPPGPPLPRLCSSIFLGNVIPAAGLMQVALALPPAAPQRGLGGPVLPELRQYRSVRPWPCFRLHPAGLPPPYPAPRPPQPIRPAVLELPFCLR